MIINRNNLNTDEIMSYIEKNNIEPVDPDAYTKVYLIQGFGFFNFLDGVNLNKTEPIKGFLEVHHQRISGKSNYTSIQNFIIARKTDGKPSSKKKKSYVSGRIALEFTTTKKEAREHYKKTSELNSELLDDEIAKLLLLKNKLKEETLKTLAKLDKGDYNEFYNE